MFNIENSSGNTWPEAVWHLLVGKAGRARAEADSVQSMRGQLEGQLSPLRGFHCFTLGRQTWSQNDQVLLLSYPAVPQQAPGEM